MSPWEAIEPQLPMVRAICREILGPSYGYLVEDAENEIALKAIEEFSQIRRIRAWLRRVAKTTAIDMLRYEQRRFHTPIEDLAEESASDSGEDASSLEAKVSIRDLLWKASRDAQEDQILSDLLHDVPKKKIAEGLGITSPNFSNRFKALKARIRDLAEEGPDPDGDDDGSGGGSGHVRPQPRRRRGSSTARKRLTGRGRTGKDFAMDTLLDTEILVSQTKEFYRLLLQLPVFRDGDEAEDEAAQVNSLEEIVDRLQMDAAIADFVQRAEEDLVAAYTQSQMRDPSPAGGGAGGAAPAADSAGKPPALVTADVTWGEVRSENGSHMLEQLCSDAYWAGTIDVRLIELRSVVLCAENLFAAVYGAGDAHLVDAFDEYRLALCVATIPDCVERSRHSLVTAREFAQPDHVAGKPGILMRGLGLSDAVPTDVRLIELRDLFLRAERLLEAVRTVDASTVVPAETTVATVGATDHVANQSKDTGTLLRGHFGDRYAAAVPADVYAAKIPDLVPWCLFAVPRTYAAPLAVACTLLFDRVGDRHEALGGTGDARMAEAYHNLALRFEFEDPRATAYMLLFSVRASGRTKDLLAAARTLLPGRAGLLGPRGLPGGTGDARMAEAYDNFDVRFEELLTAMRKLSLDHAVDAKRLRPLLSTLTHAAGWDFVSDNGHDSALEALVARKLLIPAQLLHQAAGESGRHSLRHVETVHELRDDLDSVVGVEESVGLSAVHDWFDRQSAGAAARKIVALIHFGLLKPDGNAMSIVEGAGKVATIFLIVKDEIVGIGILANNSNVENARRRGVGQVGAHSAGRAAPIYEVSLQLLDSSIGDELVHLRRGWMRIFLNTSVPEVGTEVVDHDAGEHVDIQALSSHELYLQLLDKVYALSVSRRKKRRKSKKLVLDNQAQGVVRRLTAFGAVVEIDDGVEGLIHVSEFPEGSLSVGDRLRARVTNINIPHGQIMLALEERL